jgi:DNA polymerase III gamma/tau subunit
MTHELQRRYRPKRFSDLVGQPEAVAALEGMVARGKVPHALLLTGNSGCGKTTAARILKRKMGCSNNDFEEKNAGTDGGIDTVRKIQARIGISPMCGKCRIIYMDEAAKMSGDAQIAILKLLEDCPKHAYFMLATTDPAKLIKTIHTRCTEVKFGPIPDRDLEALIRRVLEKEGDSTFTDTVIREIVDSCESSARKALVLLEQAMQLPTEQERLSAIAPPEMKRQAFEIVKSLLWEKPSWAKTSQLIKECDTSDPERFRHLVLACANTELLKANKNSERAFAVIEAFQGNWFDSKESGLAASCYQVLRG